MPEYEISARAYIKIMLHAAKYPHCAVNGILLATKESVNSNKLVVADAIPMFHQCLHVTPMAEYALIQIETMAKENGFQIVGYYSGAEHFNNNTIDKAPGARIADKIQEYHSNALFVVINNKEVRLNMTAPAIKLWHSVDGDWTSTPFTLNNKSTTLEVVSSFLSRGAREELYDFDNYLDNMQSDWVNDGLNREIAETLQSY